MSFMKPVIYQGAFYLVETSEGTELIPFDVVGGNIGLQMGETWYGEESIWKSVLTALSPFVNTHVDSVELTSGFYGWYSADGYMDCTDWVWADTEEEVSSTLEEYYGDKHD